mmetsp:Transcript_24855/g.71870  ORF Transcript_24855/g.71870 Transcript_24855/m.71870 type:complete len:892 (+) Transcript_24855:2607-5282(+)
MHEPIRVSRTGDIDGSDDTGASKLLGGRQKVDLQRFLLRVGLDATDIPCLCLADVGHERRQLGSEGRADGNRGRSTSARLRRRLLLGLGLGSVEELSGDELVVALGGTPDQIAGQRIGILGHEVGGIVFDGTGVVLDGKLGRFVKSIVDEGGGLLVDGLDLGHEGRIVTVGTDALLIEDGDDAHPTLDEAEDVGVVLVLQITQRNALILVLLLYAAEDIQRVLLLQLFIGIIDAQLLEAVDLETLKAKDVQQTDDAKVIHLVGMTVVLLGTGGGVDGLDEPVERLGVDLLGEGIASVPGGIDAEGDGVAIVAPSTGRDGTERQSLSNVVDVDAHEGGQLGQVGGRGDDGPVLVVRIGGKGESAQLKDDAHRPHEGAHLVTGDADGFQCLDGVLPLLSVRLALDGSHGGGGGGSGVAATAAIVDVSEYGTVVHQPIPNGRLGILRGGQQLVEDVVVALPGLVSDHPALLEQIRLAVRPGEEAGGDTPSLVGRLGGILDVELEPNVLAEPGGVVVPHRLGVAKGLEEGVGIQHAADHGIIPRMVADVLPRWSVGRRAGDGGGGGGGIVHRRRLDAGQMTHDDLDRLRLAGTGFAGDQDGLVGVVDGQATVRGRRGFVHVRCQAVPGVVPTTDGGALPPHQLIDVVLADIVGVQALEPLEGIHGNDDVADAGVGQAPMMAGPEVVQDGRLVQGGEVAHVVPDDGPAVLVDVLERQSLRVVRCEIDLTFFGGGGGRRRRGRTDGGRRNGHDDLGRLGGGVVRQDVGGEPPVGIVPDVHARAGLGGGHILFFVEPAQAAVLVATAWRIGRGEGQNLARSIVHWKICGGPSACHFSLAGSEFLTRLSLVQNNYFSRNSFEKVDMAKLAQDVLESLCSKDTGRRSGRTQWIELGLRIF